MITSDTYKLKIKMRNKLRKLGEGFKFSVWVKHLDLVYNGEFESWLFKSNYDMPLDEIVEYTFKNIITALEFNDCKWDEDTITAVEEQILSEFNTFSDNTAIWQGAVFFEECDGSEGAILYIF